MEFVVGYFLSILLKGLNLSPQVFALNAFPDRLSLWPLIQ